jgi:hypothetical protein
MPESSLDEFISKFWEPIDGLIRVSSFAICQSSEGCKKLPGIISYIDVLRAWQQFDEEDEMSISKIQNIALPISTNFEIQTRNANELI